MKRKLLSILVAIAVAISLSACQSQPSTETIDLVTTVVEETSEPIEMKTIEPPEDGWTVEQLNELIYINGIKYEYPATLEELTKTYTYDDDFIYNDNAGTIFYYNDTYAFGAGIDYDNVGDIGQNSKIVSATFNILKDETQMKTKDLICINGVCIGDTYEKMIKNLGTPNVIDDYYSYKYIIDNQITLVVYFFDEKEIQTIQLFWEE